MGSSKKPLSKRNKIILTIVSVFFGLIILGSILPKPKNSDVASDSKDEQTPTSTSQQSSVKQRDPVQDSLNFVMEVQSKTDFLASVGPDSGQRMAGDWSSMISELEGQQANYSRLTSNPLAQSKALKKLMTTYKKAFESAMQHNYKQARILYADEKKEALFGNNIDVQLSYDSKTLMFTGAIFANNQNKLDFKKTLEEKNIIKMLRLKFIKFRWFEGDDGTTWSYSTPDDKEIQL